MKSKIIVLFLSLFLNFNFIFSQQPVVSTSEFAKGADISWLPQMEATGYTFYNDNGIAEDCFKILKDHGINTIRLRCWVNPSNDSKNGHCSTSETVAMAVRAQQWGMSVMIDFHYSDTWADPGHQTKPAAWVGANFTTLLTDLYNYTFNVMTALSTAGVTPKWVQVGNEITNGFIYPEGSTSNWSQLAQLINKGYDAVKAVSPTTKVILHIDQGNNNSRFRNWFDNAKFYGAKYDVIGMSYYPYWLSGSPDYTLSINDLGNNLNDMVSRYGKQVMVVEVGGLVSAPQNTYDLLTAVINKVKAVANTNGLGVIYWEPEGAQNWSGYPLSAWGNDGKPTLAMNAFNELTVLDTTADSQLIMHQDRQNGIISFNKTLSKIEIININGIILYSVSTSNSISLNQLQKGVYLVRTTENNTAKVTIFKCIQ